VRVRYAAIAGMVLCAAGGAATAADRPNIIFIMTDDQGAWTPGFTGNPNAHTPHLDRLRGQGVAFTNAFVTTPVCSPARAVLMTGRFASELGIHDYLRPESEVGLDPRFVTWPALLRKSGYRTALIGKWHLGHQRPEHHPTRHGYDEFVGMLRGEAAHRNPTLEVAGRNVKFQGWREDVLFDLAIQFIERHRGAPFLLSLHTRAPHAPYVPVSEEDWAPHREAAIWVPEHPGLDAELARRQMREYHASITSIDRNLGRILAALDAWDLAKNTIVIFTSDHGYNVGHHGVLHKGNAQWLLKEPPAAAWPHIDADRRPNMWDTSLKVPLVIRWPGVVEPNSTIAHTVDFTDWFPTLCAMAGVDPPADVPLRGRDFTPLLRGRPVDWKTDLYAEYDMQTGASTHMRSWRTPRWKLMIDFKDPRRIELYNLEGDPDENRNLAADADPAQRAVMEDLTRRILAKMKEIEDPVYTAATERRPPGGRCDEPFTEGDDAKRATCGLGDRVSDGFCGDGRRGGSPAQHHSLHDG
jgi:choline-sulfatase